jgi:superfamily II DNA/RNA helicase
LQVHVGQSRSNDQVAASASIVQEVVVLREEEKLVKLKEVLAKKLRASETAIVFAARKTTCDQLEIELRKATVPSGGVMRDPPLLSWVRALHGDRDQQEREHHLQVFRSMTTKPQPGRKAVLVATDVASRALDIPGVALVVIFDFGGESDRPGVESYVHRIGRTGRAGRQGYSCTFFTREDVGASALAELLRGASQPVPVELDELVTKELAWQEKKAFRRQHASGSDRAKHRQSARYKKGGR